MTNLRLLKEEIINLKEEDPTIPYLTTEDNFESFSDHEERIKTNSKIPVSARRPGGYYLTHLIKTRPDGCNLNRYTCSQLICFASLTDFP